MSTRIEIKQIKSSIGHKQNVKKTLIALGFKKMNQVIVKNNTPQIRGMIKSIEFLLDVKEL
tara:strand:- start:997 stop:1179 length:183 start_codon:yes stop_codon:yes gene_type:complete